MLFLSDDVVDPFDAMLEGQLAVLAAIYKRLKTNIAD
tara:strand:- start:748 stop:858 length:111 start_codon:yes stop_codon:yes gene_type:complete